MIGSLFADPVPPAQPGIDLRCCPVEDLLDDVRGAALVTADPPWSYSQSPGVANPSIEGIYDCLTVDQIAATVARARHCAAKDARLVLWCTWPQLGAWMEASRGWAWGGLLTGGSWHKHGQVGVGYHWRGQSEPVLVYVQGSPARPVEYLRNRYESYPGQHSEKPLEWERAWLRAWTQPGDLVLDLYAGMAPMARACLAEGRRYVGAEIDPERHRRALGKLALWRDR